MVMLRCVSCCLKSGDGMTILFWILLVIMFCTWIGYLAVLFVVNKFICQNIANKAGADNANKLVTVIVTAYNEERTIENRIRNIIASDYPNDKLEIIVASDGSNDTTDNIVNALSCKDKRIHLMTLGRGGKSAAQNKVIPCARGEIIVLTDAESVFDEYTIKNLVSGFSDDSIGCVTGKLLLEPSYNSISKSQGIYWEYELLMRALESGAGVLHTASGSIMAFRKSAFISFDCRYGDDCIIPLDMLERGYKMRHVDNAIAFDMFPSTIRSELKARIRMTQRNISCTLSKYQLLNPFFFGMRSFAILFHKIFRWLTPYFMILLLIVNATLYNSGIFYVIAIWMQLVIYSIGTIGFIAEKINIRIPVASQIFSFMLANAGFLVGVFKAMMGESVTSYSNIQQNNSGPVNR